MPGIVGLATRMPRAQAKRQLMRMLAPMTHDSYQTGLWMDESLGIYVGWTALKDTFSDGMPLRNERGDVVLVFSGEEFSNADTVSKLEEKGHGIDVDGLSYLVRLYEDDPGFPASLNGLFQGLLVDRRRGTATLFNDRYGMRRVYYHQSNEAFYFAAEAKAILAVRPELRSVAARGLGEFIACGCVLENRSLFEGTDALPPGAAWVLRDGIVEQKREYFRPREWEDQAPLDLESYYRQVRDVFVEILPRYFRDAKVGMSLTGGLDTRMIMAWQKFPPGCLPCYSFGGMFRNCQDVLLAQKVATLSGQPHHVIQVGHDFLRRFPDYAKRTVYLTEGCVDVSLAPCLYLSERAAKTAPIRMTGNYGGEVLRHLRAFKPVEPDPRLFCPEVLSEARAAKNTYAGLNQGHPLSFTLFRQAPWHHQGLLALEQTQVCQRSPYLDNDFVQTVFRAPESAFANNDVRLRLVADGDAKLAQLRTDRGDGRNWKATVTRAILDFTVKAEYAYDYGMPQWVAQIDHLLSTFHLERLFLGRHKFYHFRIWYREALSPYVRELLLDPRTLSRPYLERKTLETMVKQHLQGCGNYTTEIHKVLTLELLHRLFIDAASEDLSSSTPHIEAAVE